MTHDAAPSPQKSDPHLAELLSRIDGIIANEAGDALAASGRSVSENSNIATPTTTANPAGAATPGLAATPEPQTNAANGNEGNQAGKSIDAGPTPPASSFPAPPAVSTTREAAGATCDVAQEGPSFGRLTGHTSNSV